MIWGYSPYNLIHEWLVNPFSSSRIVSLENASCPWPQKEQKEACLQPWKPWGSSFLYVVAYNSIKLIYKTNAAQMLKSPTSKIMLFFVFFSFLVMEAFPLDNGWIQVSMTYIWTIKLLTWNIFAIRVVNASITKVRNKRCVWN